MPKGKSRETAAAGWTPTDSLIVGAAAGIGLGAALVAHFGGLPRVQALVGLALVFSIAYLSSSARRAIDWRTVGWGMTLQIVFALIVLKTTIGQTVFETLGGLITRLLSFSDVGSGFVFGVLGDRPLWGQVMATTFGEEGKDYVLIFAFQVLPTIIFIAALFAILYYFGVMQLVVRFFAWMMRKVMRASGAETLNVAASIFMGQTEAPLTIRPFLPKMTQSELMTVMTSGMAHISGGIMAAYILFGIEAKHLLTAVIMTAPGTLMMAKLFVPETETPETLGTVKLQVEKTDVNLVDAAGRGTSEGLHLALNVGAMLISFLALVALDQRAPRGRRPVAAPARADAELDRPRLARHLARSPEPAGDPGLGLRPDRVGAGRAVARRRHDRQPARHAHGAERVRGLFAARRAQGRARSALVHDRDLRALRLRQFLVDRHPARRASARWPRRGARIWRGSACGR